MSPGALKKPLLKLNRLIGHASAKNHISKPTIGNIAALDEDKHSRKIEKIQAQQEKELQREDEKKSLQIKRHKDEELAHAEDPPEIAARYGTSPDKVTDTPRNNVPFALLKTDGPAIGTTIGFKARVHHVRSMGPRLAFVILRQGIDTIQGVLEYREGAISEGFVRWAEHLISEGIVYGTGTIKSPKEPVAACTIQSIEILIESMHLTVPIQESLPIDVYSIDRVEENPETKQIEYLASNRVRTSNRISFLRTPTAQCIFRLNSAICSAFRHTLEGHGFIEIHTPKLQPAATESGAEVFKVNYYGRTAFLAQSPQLAKQLCISADFGRVFEIGPVFRAEDSNTHRHLSEYIGLDLEMVIQNNYHEALDIIDDLLKSIFAKIYKDHRKELDIVKTHFPHDDLVWLEKTPRLKFKDAIALLNESGWKDEYGNPASDTEDLSTPAERRIGELVKEKYGTDFYIIDKFPTSARPFYTHLDDEDPNYTNSFDIFLRGQEITTGGQRINDPAVLKKRMGEVGVNMLDMEEYLQGFDYGVLPHAGCGIGLERVLFLLLNLGDIRNASLFPRDSKSLQPHDKGWQALPHPEADTIRYSANYARDPKSVELPSVEKLISNYGDATNTSWLDDRYEVWRHAESGAAIGYASVNGYALIMGNPLCDPRQYPLVVRRFLKDLRKVHDLRPLWLLVSPEIEEILGGILGWRTFSCVAEDRLEVDSMKKVAKKERQAEEAGVRIFETNLGEHISDDFREKVDKRVEEWKAKRTGKQVHITDVRPWLDVEHRKYVWAENREGDIVALVILHRLAPKNGYQIKFALDFPGSPGGAIESVISHAIQGLAKMGVKCVTFGAGATKDIEIGNNLNGLRAKILSRTYRAIAQQLKLASKGEFREKFGTEDDPVYICYPFMGLGVSGARTLIRFFEDEI
ncbi:hypothetical protein jhhlp_000779 [Lomentospora prolificans]|uniref:Probable aspartate--tRNA ligase, cytoplasmic n=1 Tax=Lomentospora prolificans TaxID=41688 RepID=A0A2N3NJI9_9PEZI|nr:hypothetical protein jhhlp_000779 [Lomentospora prolificans]